MLGQFKSTLNEKGRMNFPSKFRDELGDSFVLAQALSNERCITVYSNSEWAALLEKINELPKVKSIPVRRKLLGRAYEIEADKQGRVVIPPELRRYADIKDDIITVGQGDYAEIWDKTAWEEYNSGVDNLDIVRIA